MVAGAGVVVKLERDKRIREKRAPIAAMDGRRQTWQRVKVVQKESNANLQGAHSANPFNTLKKDQTDHDGSSHTNTKL
jgi:hypothetical protein